MGDNCSDCIQAKLVEKLTERVISLEDISRCREITIGDMKCKIDVNANNTEMVFKTLTEIKDSLKIIADKILALEKIPGQNWRDLIKIVMSAAVGAAVTFFAK